MAIRDFFLPLTSYPRPATEAAIEAVFRVCEGMTLGFDSQSPSVRPRVSAVVYEIEIEPGLYFEGASVGTFLDEQSEKSTRHAQQLVGSFEAVAARHSVLHQCRLERRTAYDAIQQVVEAARLHHVTVRPLRMDDGDQFDLTEQVIFESGRPVLIFPEEKASKLSQSFRTVAIAWDGSRQATRAVEDAMPFLRQAEHVRVFTATDDKELSSAQAEQFIALLENTGIAAIHEDVKRGDNGIGALMTSYVQLRDVDLLVMGAYGHSRLREFVLGGATRSMLEAPPTWVLLSH